MLTRYTTHPRRLTAKLSAVTLAATLAAASSTYAALCFEETFNYTGALHGQAGTGIGETGNWTSSRTTSSLVAGTSPSLTYGSLTTSNNRLVSDYDGFGTNDNTYVTLDTTAGKAGAVLNTDATSQWMSLIVKTPTAFQASRGFSLYTDRGSTFKYWGFSINGDGTWNTFVNATSSAAGSALTANTTYLFLFKVTRTNNSSYTIEGWNYSGGTIPGSDPTSGLTATGAGGSTNNIVNLFLSATNAGQGAMNQYEVDELRIGSTLADVTPVPEPSTFAAMAGAAALAFAAGRRFLRRS